MQKIKISSLYQSQQSIFIGVLLVFYLVGLIGLRMPAYRNQMLGLSAMNLLLSFVILILSRKSNKLKFLWFLVLCFSIGMVVEWIGVHTGYLFGQYHYGNNLGLKLEGIPIIIGINWGILSVCSCELARLFFSKKMVINAIVSAGLMTLLDFLIEPVAIQSDYWQWETTSIPVYNYVCWFVISFPLHYLYFKMKLNEQNRVSIALFLIMTFFFTVLNF
jgi:putative membrane protein